MTVDPAEREIIFAATHTAPGGLRAIWEDVAGGLQQRGYRVSKLALYPQGPERGEAEAKGWQYVAATPPNAMGMPRLLTTLVQQLRRDSPGVVVTGMPLANVLFPIAAQLAGSGTRVIPSHHTPVGTYHPMLARIDRLTGRLPAVAAIVTVSDAVRDSFVNWPAAYRARQVTIGNALPEQVELQIARIAQRWPHRSGTGRRIVAVGRLTRQKNYPTLVRAMATVPDARLDIIGAGEDEAALRAQIDALGLADRVNLIGQLPREQTLERVGEADVFVQISLYEGHSLALIEAAKLGLPLVVSDAPVQIEAIRDPAGQPCGMVVPTTDATALAAALNALFDDAQVYAYWQQNAARLGEGLSSRGLIDRYGALLSPFTGGGAIDAG